MGGRVPHIVIDPGGLDALTLAQGQFRYVLDLLGGLRELDPAARFTVLGASTEPAPGLAGLFDAGHRPWKYVHLPRPAGRGSLYLGQARIASTLLRVGADLYHGLHTVLPACSPCPIIATIHDMMYEIFPEYENAAQSRPYRLYRWAARVRARRLVCISRATADDVRRYWRVPESRLDVVYHGTTFFAPGGDAATVRGVPPSGPIVVSPYNLEPRKNLSALATSFSRVLEAIPSARLVLFGRSAVTPRREAEFDRLIDSSGIAGATIRTGFLSDEQLGWLYRRATVFAFPSLYEGFGYPVLEAMAAGACVVARGASSMAEILGDAGATVGDASPDELGDAILGLLRDDGRRAALGRAARLRSGEFTVRRMAEGTLSSYGRALGRAILPAPGGAG